MSCIYIIKCLDETVPEIYIGSTNDYKQRQRQHKHSCDNPNNTNHNYKLYRFIRSKGGIDKFKFEVIEECSNEDKIEIEKMYIEMYNPELNTHKYYFDKKEYREKNKDKIAEKQKQYNIKNKDNIAEKQKQYYIKHKEKLKEYSKEIIGCRACRCEITKANFKRHCKSKKHINQTVISQ